MTRHTVHGFACLLLLTALTLGENEQSRWSRQISTYTADISDWVPLPGPVDRDQPQGKRQAVAEPRILTEPFPGFVRPTAFTQSGGFNQDPFPSRTFYNAPGNRQLYLQSLPAVPSAPQNFLSEQGFGQSIRFGLTNPNFPLNQGFVAPQLSFDTIPQINAKTQQAAAKPLKFENIPQPSQSQKPQVQTFITQTPKFKPELPKFFDGYRMHNVSTDYNTKRPQSLQKLKYDGVKTETITQKKPQVEREEVQLLYVPLESLNSGQFNFRSPVATPQIINSDLFNQKRPLNTPVINSPATDFHKPTTKAMDNFSPKQEFSSNFNAHITNVDQIPKFTTLSSPFPTVPPSTSKPKKLKPHQPPLAIFLTQDSKKDNQVKVGDVLYSLKNANTIDVLDAVNPQNAPKVFIGPSSLSPPEKYVKFELPYLSNIENSEKRLRQLPFFVAPLSYNTPQGFAKIPFPSPHVGSVVINSQINKDSAQPTQTTSIPNIPPSFYAYNQSPTRQVQNLDTQKPKINYYTTISPKTKTPVLYEPNYYTLEQQAGNALRTPTPEKSNSGNKPSSYFLSNIGSQYNPSDFVNFPSEPNYHAPGPVQTYSIVPTARTTLSQRPSTSAPTTTSTSTTTTTTIKPSTYPSPLLETHNPYSINQAFHFSTPIDYQNFFDEYKENYAAPGQNPSAKQQTVTNISSSSSVPLPQEKEKTQTKYSQSSPGYLQGYTPEIHYESEVQNSRYSAYNTNQQTTESAEIYKQTNSPVVQNESFESSSYPTPIIPNKTFEPNNISTPEVQNEYIMPSSDLAPPRNDQEHIENEPTLPQNNEEIQNNTPLTSYENHIPATGPTYDYNQYETTFNNGESEQTPQTTTTTTTTTTRRTPLRTRGRPRYPTTKTDTGEYTTRTVITRRPLRERRPLVNRPRYEPNKITTEKPSKPTTDAVDTTTKYKRTRTRGRVHYKPSEADNGYEKRAKAQSSKENDLAYQRDVLHQNYPVTLMERMSTVDIEAITEPTIKLSSSSAKPSEDSDNAYSYDKVTVTEHTAITENKNEQHEYTDALIKDSYIPNLPSAQSDEYPYEQKSSIAPVGTYPTYDEMKGEDIYNKQTTPLQSTEFIEVTTPSIDENVRAENEQSVSANNRPEIINEEEITTKNIENNNNQNQEENQSVRQEENIIQTTPSYNRVRVRPGVIRQYHPASTESSRVRVDRRRPGQAITYRPAYDRRRTTMRIDEIEADLKTKQVHSRPEFQDYKQPVYKPEPTTESTGTSSSTQETSTKRGTYRRRRPTYTISSTETPTYTKKTYEIKNRFRGRRPTEKPEVQTEPITSTTVRDAPIVKYNDKPRLSERFNQNPQPEEVEDQDPNYSIQRPSYATLDTNRWSPKISADYFKPYNPNDIVEESKAVDAENQSNNGPDLDIITAKNEYDNILISVTPATNNRANKKIPDIPPTLEALVEQSRITNSEGSDTMSTFESMLEEVMKSLEEQDEDEYTKNVMKHKGGEIGEIPPEKIITSEENFYSRSTTPLQEIPTSTASYEESELVTESETKRKTRRRGFWKKVKVRPATTESIEVAESQYYPNTVNRLGHAVKLSKHHSEKSETNEKSKVTATTYKPRYQFIKDFFETDNDEMEITPHIDIPKITTVKFDNQKTTTYTDNRPKTTIAYMAKETTESLNPEEMDLGTGSPDPTFSDTYFTTVTESITRKSQHSAADRSDGFSLMDYFFGVTSSDTDTQNKAKNETKRDETEELKSDAEVEGTEIRTEQAKLKPTTETTYIPEEITTYSKEENYGDESKASETDIVKMEHAVENVSQNQPNQIETSSVSSFMDSLRVVSTSMSTEISHETEICFRGKCIKTNKSLS